MSVLLKKPLFEGISQKELAEQLESKKKCRDKLPSWFNTSNIYYPNKLNIEQTSSELSAQYKSGIVSGKTLVDVTGGLGVDSYYFAKYFDSVFHCELDESLSEIAIHNFNILGCSNVQSLAINGLDFLEECDEKIDWIYADPSRRNDKKGKVFLLRDCLPNISEHLSFLFEKTNNILLKTSPLLDISQGIKELNFVKEIHIVAVQNEVKELLFLLKRGFRDEIQVKAVNIVQGENVTFDFKLEAERKSATEFGRPETYIYEPNVAILKSGGFKSLGEAFNLKKLHQHSHLYTSSELVDFPGRRFKVLETLPYSKKGLKSIQGAKANVTTRNFPISVSDLKKKHKIKDGGSRYLFFTKTLDDQLVVLDCEKCS